MAFRLSFADFLRNKADGIKDFATEVADKTGKFVCESWALYPGTITNNSLVPVNLVRGILGSFCQDDAPPPPNVPPECEQSYHIFGEFISKNFGSGGCDVTAFWRTGVAIPESELADTTPILHTNNRWVINTVSGTKYNLRILSQTLYDDRNLGDVSGTEIINRLATQNCLNTNAAAYGHSFVTVETLPKNDLPETCRDDISFPDDAPPPIVSKQVSISFGDVIQTHNLEIVNNINGSFGFPITVNWSGQMNVTIDAGGFTIENGGGNPAGEGGNGEETETPKPVTPTPQTEIPDVEVDLVSKKPFLVDDFDQIDLEEGEELEEAEVEDELVRYVLIDVTTLPEAGKIILQAKSADNDFFAGYFSWTVVAPGGQYRYPAQPIRKSKNAFEAPTQAVGYTAYTVNGAKIKITQFNQKIEVQT